MKNIISAIFFIVVSFFLFSINGYADSKKIIIAADEWCPYNCSPDDKEKPGYMVEIVRAVFNKAGYQVEYRVMSFPRALQETLKGGIDGTVAVDAGTAREATEMYSRTYGKPAAFAHSDIMAVTHVSFYTAADSAWSFDRADPEASIKALNGKVGVPQGYSYDISLILKKMNAQVGITGDTPMEQLLKMLEAGQIKAIVDDDAVVRYVAEKMGMEKKIRYGGATAQSLDCFIGFSAQHQDYADILNKGMEDLRISGELALILQKYNVPDWKK